MAHYIRPEIRDEVLLLHGLTIDLIAEDTKLRPETVKLAFQQRGRNIDHINRIAKVIEQAGYQLNRETDILPSSRTTQRLQANSEKPVPDTGPDVAVVAIPNPPESDSTSPAAPSCVDAPPATILIPEQVAPDQPPSVLQGTSSNAPRRTSTSSRRRLVVAVLVPSAVALAAAAYPRLPTTNLLEASPGSNSGNADNDTGDATTASASETAASVAAHQPAAAIADLVLEPLSITDLAADNNLAYRDLLTRLHHPQSDFELSTDELDRVRQFLGTDEIGSHAQLFGAVLDRDAVATSSTASARIVGSPDAVWVWYVVTSQGQAGRPTDTVLSSPVLTFSVPDDSLLLSCFAFPNPQSRSVPSSCASTVRADTCCTE